MDRVEAIDSHPHPCDSRTVTPNFRRYNNAREIITINHREVLHERTGAITSHGEFADALPELPRSLIVTFGAEQFLLALHTRYRTHPRWQWKVTVTGYPLLRKKVCYFGFKRTGGSKSANKDRGHTYHVVVDFNSFVRTDQRIGYDARDLESLLRLGQELREFCSEFNLEIKPTASGLANQLLRHPLFYPEPRRQVPSFINETVRKHLPGNHYALYSPGQKIDAATYIDQQAAHHHAALTTPLPNANSIVAKGYRKGELKTYARYSEQSDSLYQRLLTQHGLACVRANVPYLSPRDRRFVPDYMQEAGPKVLWLWTNEIAYAQSKGLDIRCIYATWGTAEIDYGIKRYAAWAVKVQDRYPWLKTVLLMPYGLLAKRPAEFDTHFPGGKDSLILANELVDTHKTTTHVVSRTANVLQRGLIEAYVRTLSLDMADKCSAKYGEVISIYADGIFLRIPDSGQIPLSTPWREKAEVTELEFESAMRFRSKELSRFPGTPRFARDYVRTTNSVNVESTQTEEDLPSSHTQGRR